MRVAVIGGGIAGLAAAWELVSRQPDTAVTVFDPGPLGGKIRTTDVEGRPVDEGPDAFLTRVPDAVALCAELGLSDELVAPAAGTSMLWWGDRLRPLPEGLVLGVPRRLDAIARSGLLSPLGIVRAGLDLVLPRRPLGPDDDLSVFDLVASRFGAEVATRLVDPLVGGIHAGRTDELSAVATVPQLVAVARRSRSLLLGLRSQAAAAPTGPIFLTPRAGAGRLVEVLVDRLAAAGVRFVEAPVATVGSAGGTGVALDGDARFDAAVIAAPAPVAAGLVAGADPAAAAGLRAIEHASVVLTTMTFPADAVGAPAGVNGFLVPRAAGHLTTACSFGSAKWPHWSAPDRAILRVSAGRHRDDRALHLDDTALVDRLVAELGAALGRPLPSPSTARVSRWPDAFPQYTVGHLARVSAIEAALATTLPAVRLAGSAYRGSGIPACIGSGRRAAAALLAAATLPA